MDPHFTLKETGAKFRTFSGWNRAAIYNQNKVLFVCNYSGLDTTASRFTSLTFTRIWLDFLLLLPLSTFPCILLICNMYTSFYTSSFYRHAKQRGGSSERVRYPFKCSTVSFVRTAIFNKFISGSRKVAPPTMNKVLDNHKDILNDSVAHMEA